MPKKDGTPTNAERRIVARVRENGGRMVLTKNEYGNHYTLPDGRKIASDDSIVERLISQGLFCPCADDGLFPGIPQTYEPAL